MLFGYILFYSEYRAIALVQEAQALDSIWNNFVVIRVVVKNLAIVPRDEAQILLIWFEATVTCEYFCPGVTFDPNGLKTT